MEACTLTGDTPAVGIDSKTPSSLVSLDNNTDVKNIQPSIRTAVQLRIATAHPMKLTVRLSYTIPLLLMLT